MLSDLSDLEDKQRGGREHSSPNSKEDKEIRPIFSEPITIP